MYSSENPSQWAQDNCPSYLSGTLWLKEDPETSTADYHFAEEKDSMIFSLRWL
jgi:hypothetical protein